MIKPKKDGTWEVDWELTGKVALEANYELQEKVGELEEEIKKLKEANGEMFDRIIRDERYEGTLEEENKKLKEDKDYYYDKCLSYCDEIVRLKEHIKELEDELWVWKHSYHKLMKDKELYEKARDVMFGPEEEDLYEDIDNHG